MKTLTYSSTQLFKNCRAKYYWRIQRQIVKAGKPASSLYLGAAVHKGLEMMALGQDLQPLFEEYQFTPILEAILTGYIARYQDCNWTTIRPEVKFSGPIVNPKTGRKSKTYEFAGMVDGIVDEHILLETKTVSNLDGAYLDRLALDTQIHLYAAYLGCEDVLYNMIRKSMIKLKKGETEAEFKARLMEVYKDPAMFERVLLAITPEQIERHLTDLWQVAQNIGQCERENHWYCNTDFCTKWGRKCEYFPLCSSGGNELLIDLDYQHKPAHNELAETEESEVLF